MLSVAEAHAIVLQHARPLPPQVQPLTPAALGAVLAEDVASDLDMPPFDKALMDGYAIRSADLPDGSRTFAVVEEITAGRAPTRAIAAGQAARIMTGAPMPEGADAVVMVERTQLVDADRVRVDDRPAKPGQNAQKRGQEMRRGETVLTAGSVLRPQEFGLLASVGRRSAKVYPQPEISILVTGDELVDAEQLPGPGQIRNSNGPVLAAQVARAGGVSRSLGIAPDRVDSLSSLIAEGLKSSILVLSGGVSAGKLDLVPGVLQELGVAPHFHKVAMKPGKPVFFGTRGDTLVFGLPGNPVSALVCFELFVRPALRRLAGHVQPGPFLVQALLADNFPYRTDRPTYHPARLEETETGRQVRPVPWLGSPDLRGLTEANAFLLLPVGDFVHRAGEVYPVLVIEDCGSRFQS
jgi:molybdopterin molybdotransferase